MNDNTDFEDESMLLYKTEKKPSNINNSTSQQLQLQLQLQQQMQKHLLPHLQSKSESFNTVHMNFESRVTRMLKPQVQVR
ncbi:hypothetical protein PP707_07595, partial [Acetobacter pasteurianus]|nr:hypothetical protein [Acetobacter pasteurianus]